MTTRRKGGAPKSMEAALQMEQVPLSSMMMGDDPTSNNETNGHAVVNGLTGKTLTIANTSAPLAVVKRRKYGTGPFDENWLNRDCCGLFCALITYGLHCYGVYAVCLVLLPPWMSETDEEGVRSFTLAGHFHRLAFTATAVLAVAAHFKAMTTDPGAVPPDAIPLEETKPLEPINSINNDSEENGEGSASPRKGKKLCRRCKTFKPKRAHHCSVCRRCIIKMDHHCPWVNNCVGIGNHKYFLLFVFYTFLSCLYSFLLVMIRFYTCMGQHGHVRTHRMTCLDRPSQLLTILGLLVEAFLFGMFTACMVIDQSSVVSSKMTHIDRLKGGEDDPVSSLAGVIEVFGLSARRGNDPRFRPDWLSPFAKVCFPSSLQDEIMGFCRPCGGGRSKDTEQSTSPMARSVAEIV